MIELLPAWLGHALDFLLHLEVHLTELIRNYGTWTYLILFAIIFTETGIVIFPFLPGDSLLFVAGALCATGALDPFILSALLMAAAFLGNLSNYVIARRWGESLLSQRVKLINQNHLERTRIFFQRYGGSTIIMARFVPIIRTVAPFVAGIGRMHPGQFNFYSAVGSVVWIGSFIGLGYFFGNLPWVKQNLSWLILAIIVISVLPVIIGFIKSKNNPSHN